MSIVPTEYAKTAPAPPPYQDRVMEGVAPDEVDLAAKAYDPQGWPRGITLQRTRNLQLTRNAASTANTRTDTQGFQIDAYIETPNFGALSAHALALGGRSTTGLTSWSLRQTGLPFDGGWRADNALGTTNLLVPELARRNSRLALPSTQVLGGSTVWRNQSGLGLVLGASVGEPGRFEGFPQSRFVGLGGRVQSAFAQSTFGEWTAAAAVAQGSSILPDVAPTRGDGSNTAPRVSPRGFYLSAATNERVTGTSWQASALGSNNGSVDATGLWADAIWRDGGHRQQLSLFRFERDLTWIDRPLPADLQGASYRYDFTSLRWDIATNVESFSSVSKQNPSGWYASASARRLLSAGISAGGGLALRQYGASSESGFGYVQWQNRFGVSRVQVDVASARRGQRSEGITFDHSLYAENGFSLSTTLGLEWLRPFNATTGMQQSRERATTLGINGRGAVGNNLTLQGGIRARNLAGDAPYHGTSLAATIGVDWQINRDWTFGGSLYENRGVLTETLGVLSPLAVPEIVRTRPNDRGFFIALRYGTNAGTPIVPLGGPPGSGAGRLEGSVFLDANNNGLRDANETPAANVLVTLDGKFSARTNASGAFEFASVAAGVHTLTVLQDDLPLPWTLDTEQKITASISTRATTRIDIGAKRMR